MPVARKPPPPGGLCPLRPHHSHKSIFLSVNFPVSPARPPAGPPTDDENGAILFLVFRRRPGHKGYLFSKQFYLACMLPSEHRPRGRAVMVYKSERCRCSSIPCHPVTSSPYPPAVNCPKSQPMARRRQRGINRPALLKSPALNAGDTHGRRQRISGRNRHPGSTGP